MFFFVDESWSPNEYPTKFGVLLGVLMPRENLKTLDNFLYKIRFKYFNKEHAKDLSRELKGTQIISNQVLKKWQETMPINLCIAYEILKLPIVDPLFYCKVFASSIYSETLKPPQLLAPYAKQLTRPFRELIEKVSCAAHDFDPTRNVTLIFDERPKIQKDLAISIKNFISGMRVSNIESCPYFAVSHASSGVQIADLFVSILSKRIQKIPKVITLYNHLKKLQWESINGPKRWGFSRYDEHIDDNKLLKYTIRRKW